MKRHLTFFLSLAMATMAIAEIPEVVSNTRMGKGYYPLLSNDGSQIEYATTEFVEHNIAPETGDIYVTNEDLLLVLYNNGERKELYPYGKQVNYVWASLSPNKEMILFNTKYGTAICDLEGNVLQNFGSLNAPVWYGNDYVVGMNDIDNGDTFVSSSIVIASVDGLTRKVLTDASEIGMYPSTAAAEGMIAYNTLDGNIRLIQLNNGDEKTIRRRMPRMVKSESLPEGKRQHKAPKATQAMYEKFSDVKIYINPGHGGHDPDDRNITIYPFKQGDPEGFWESNSNLDKGLKLNEWLQELGMQTKMSRITNTTADDRALSAIVAEANAYHADFMLSIHSNAGGPANYVLELYAGKDLDDTRIYADEKNKTTQLHSHDISTLIGNNLLENKITTWSSPTARITGDKTFGRDAMGWSNGYGVLRGLTVPGVISEGCMHDYLPEAYRMMNMDYKWKESWYFMKTFCTYFLDYKLPEGVIAGQVRDAYNKLVFPAIKTIKGSRDELLPIDTATVILLQEGKEVKRYKTDTLYNGVFFFWNLKPGTYTIRVEAANYYEKEAEVVVEANEITYQDMMLDMKRMTRPQVLSYSPHVELTDSQEVATPILLNFNWDMLEEPTLKAFKISPEVEGTVELINSQRTLQFKPKSMFEMGTEYTVTLDKSACHPDTNFPNTMEEDFTFKFRTKNRPGLRVIQTYPVDGAKDIDLQTSVMVIFDMKLDAPSSKPATITLSDGNGYTMHPSTRVLRRNSVPSPYGSLRFDLTDETELKPNTTYTITLEQTIKDTCNVLMLEPYRFSFTTISTSPEYETEVLNSIDSIFFTYDEDLSNNVSEVTVIAYENKSTLGKYSNAIGYVFAGQADDESLFLTPKVLTYEYTDSDTLLLDVYGDLSYNEIYLRFSTDGDLHEIKMCDLDYSGWHTWAADLSTLPHDVKFQFVGMRIVRKQSLLSNKGTLYVDALRRIRSASTGVQNLTPSSVSVYPNPANTMLTVEGADSLTMLTLYSLDGKVIRQHAGKQMNTSDIGEGMYVLRVETNNGTINHSVIIAH